MGGDWELDTPRLLEVDGATCWAVPDLLLRTSQDGRWLLADWKVSERGRFERSNQDSHEAGHRAQLAAYALYVCDRCNVAPEAIVGRVEFLVDGQATEYRFSEADLDMARQRMAGDIATMRDCQGLGREGFSLRQDASRCPECCMFELCQGELAARNAGPFSNQPLAASWVAIRDIDTRPHIRRQAVISWPGIPTRAGEDAPAWTDKRI